MDEVKAVLESMCYSRRIVAVDVATPASRNSQYGAPRKICGYLTMLTEALSSDDSYLLRFFEVLENQDSHAVLRIKISTASLVATAQRLHRGARITFFANLLYSCTKTARSSNSSVSLNRPSSPLLEVQVRLLRP